LNERGGIQPPLSRLAAACGIQPPFASGGRGFRRT